MNLENLLKKLETYWKSYETTQILLGLCVGFILIEKTNYILWNFEGLKKNFLNSTFGFLKSIPIIKKKYEEEISKIKDQIVKEFNSHSLNQGEKLSSIPSLGMSHQEILKKMKELKDYELPKWKSGKISGAIYGADEKHYSLQSEVYSMFSITNPLHPDIFPSIRKFESEIIKMTRSMLHGDEQVCGAVTSGGTESIIMAVKAHRDYYSHVKNPEMIVPVTAHAAFNKAGSYLGVKIVQVPIDQNGKASIDSVRKSVNRNTIMIVGSAPNFPHGIIDPIEELAAIAQKNGIGFHTDACLGGFFLPWVLEYSNGKISNFDFLVPGVTSISCDTHKYGYSTKGTSVLLFKNQDLRHSMYFVFTEWPGGVYASPAMAGSRPGGLIACCWASLVAIGKDGFYEKSKNIYDTVQLVKEGIKKIPQLELVGDSFSNVLAFKARNLDIFTISEAMKSRGYHLNNLQKPNCIHICFTANHSGKANYILKDIENSIADVEKNPSEFKESAAMYGMSGTFPDRTAVKDVATLYIDTLLTQD